MSTPLNRVANDPSLADLLELLKKDIFLNLNCHAIATIQSFDSSTQLVSATINYKKTFLKADALGMYSSVLVDYPILIDCPIIMMQGGNGVLTFPIATGDTCLILFNDRDIDNWLHSGQVGPVGTQRFHSFSDGIALVGLRPTSNPVLNYDSSRVVLKNGTATLALGLTKIELSNATSNLNTLLQELMTELENLTTAIAAITVICAAPGSPSSPPVNAAAFVALGTQITTTATKIGGLLQ